MSDEEDKLYEEYGEQMPLPMPKSWTDLHAKFEDHAYFFILTSRQALKASWVLEQRHEQMPHFRQEDRMRAWRDYLEHWDKPDSSRPAGRTTSSADWIEDDETEGDNDDLL